MSFLDIWMKLIGWEVKYHIASLEVDCMGAAYCYWPYYRWLIKHQYWEAVPVGWVGRYSKNMKIQESSLLFQKYSHVENARLAHEELGREKGWMMKHILIEKDNFTSHEENNVILFQLGKFGQPEIRPIQNIFNLNLY